MTTYRSWEMLSKSALFSGLVCMRKLTVRTNWPTVAEKPERNALKGCGGISLSARRSFLQTPQVQLLVNQHLLHLPSPIDRKTGVLTKLPAITQYANCNTPTAIKKTRKASSSLTRCGVSSTYLFQMPTPISCTSCALRTWPLALEAGLLAERVGWPAEEGTTVVALVAVGGMAEGEGVVGTFLGAILFGL